MSDGELSLLADAYDSWLAFVEDYEDYNDE